MDKQANRNQLYADGAVCLLNRHQTIIHNKKPAGHRSKLSAGFNGLLMGGHHGK